MLRPDHVTLVQLGLEVGDLEHLFGLLGQGNVSHSQRPASAANRVLDGLLQFEEIASQVAKDLDGNAFTFADDTEQEMLRTDVVVTETNGLFAAVGDDVTDAV